VGASYATEKRNAQYFDPELAKLATGLGKALPGSPTISFADASQDEARLLVIASGDTNAGMVYLFEKAGKRLSEVMPVRPELEGNHFPHDASDLSGGRWDGHSRLSNPARRRQRQRIARDRHASWRPSARDEWGFDWLVQYFAARGLRSCSPTIADRAAMVQTGMNIMASSLGERPWAMSTMRVAGW
jgi:hypothetical protein